MQCPLQTYKFDIFSNFGQAYVMWCQHNLNKVCSNPRDNFHDDWTHIPTLNDKNVNLGCCITFGTFDIVMF